MACEQLNKSFRDNMCKTSIGGLKAVYFISDADPLGTTLTYVSNTDKIDTISGGNPTLYKYDLDSFASSFDQTIVSSREAGTSMFEQKLSINIKGLTFERHKEIKLLTYGMFKVIVADQNSNFWLMGWEYNADVTGGSIVTGTAMADKSSYTLELTARERKPAMFFDDTTEANVLTAISGTLQGY